jgi:SNF2 family DNA or RNA helicase
MRKTGTAKDFERRKRTIRSSQEPMSPKHWPTALIVCPKSLINNVCELISYKSPAHPVIVGARTSHGEFTTTRRPQSVCLILQWGYFEVREWKSELSTEIRKAFNQGFIDIREACRLKLR